MGTGEIVGGVALVGVAVLIGLALLDEDAPATLTESTLVDPAARVDAAAPSTTAPVGSIGTTTARPTESAGTTPTTEAPTTSPSSAPTTSTPPTSAAPPTTLSSAQRAAISVQVINGGAPSGAAGLTTEAVRAAGFSVTGPADAPAPIAVTTVFYAPGQQAAAAAVSTVVGAQPANVLEGTASQPSWAALGADLDVLVVLGPTSG